MFNFRKDLLINLIARDIKGRYKGSMLGAVWALLNPMMMLAVYTFVFSVVFKARWSGGSGSKTEFALLLFSGLIIFNIFAECLNRSPSTIISNPNFVKKVVFPIELLAIVALGTSLFQAAMSFCVWLVFYFIFYGVPPVTIFLLPIVIIPLLLFTLGITWVISAFSVYVRDVIQIIGVVTTLLLFLSPVFYSITMLPDFMQSLMKINPLTIVIEQARDVMIWGKSINLFSYVLQLIISIMVFLLGLCFFQKAKRGFADVL